MKKKSVLQKKVKRPKNVMEAMMSDPNRNTILNNQSGFVLVLAMLIMVVLIVIGVTSIKTSRIENLIAGNEKFHKQTFYEAESGISLAMETIRLNFDDNTTGFSPGSTLPPGDNVTVMTSKLWQNSGAVTCPTDTNRDIFYPSGYTTGDPHTNIRLTGRTVHAEGAALQMAAGYEGIGKGAAGGGTHKIYNIYSQRIGFRDSESNVQVEWRFVP